MQVAIVTGSSKGLGFSIARLLLEQGIHVIGISRTEENKLAKIAEASDVTYHHFAKDLGNLEELKDCIQGICEQLKTYSLEMLYLLNNAAVLEPIDPAHKISVDDLAFHMQVNTVAPMSLMNALLDFSMEAKLPFYGVNISSGAAERPVFGWSAYCSGKALINRYTETVALEQDSLETGNKVFAFSPGVMDTNMQAQIRGSDESSFKDVGQFIRYKEENALRTTDDVAQIIIDILRDESTIQNGRLYHVTDYI